MAPSGSDSIWVIQFLKNFFVKFLLMVLEYPLCVDFGIGKVFFCVYYGGVWAVIIRPLVARLVENE